MKVELICVGTEILLGDIINTNATYLAEKFAALGLSCYFQTVVGDNEERLIGQIKTSIDRSDIVVLSGGLGPTEDDLTKEATAKAFHKKLVLDQESKDRIISYFEKKQMKPTDNNWKQSMIPEGAITLINYNGTAPGIILEENNKHIILLPGPPKELKPMFEESVIPYIQSINPGVIYSKTVKLCGIGESRAETMVVDLIENQDNPTIATYAKTGEVHIRVTAKAEDKKEAKKLIKPVVEELKVRFGSYVFTTKENVTFEMSIVELLKQYKFTFSCAESCTGGLLSARMINVPGISKVYHSGYITYANQAKRNILGVKKSTLLKYGAVSRQTAEQMAIGAAKISKSDVAISITGIAGPEGGSEEKPVGLVYISCYIRKKITTNEYFFVGNRETIRESAVSMALLLLKDCLQAY